MAEKKTINTKSPALFEHKKRLWAEMMSEGKKSKIENNNKTVDVVI